MAMRQGIHDDCGSDTLLRFGAVDASKIRRVDGFRCSFRDKPSLNPWSDLMKKPITAVCVALFALAAPATHAADDKKKTEPAKAAASAPAAKGAASAPAAKAAPAATTASAPAKKKEKKGGC
jgi:hypothetical protein